ncbi:2-dehydro-3-deoxyphosphooctonate aldolase [mine drainage metagenome]
METHPHPDAALSDGQNMYDLDRMEALLASLCEIDRMVKAHPYPERLDAY